MKQLVAVVVAAAVTAAAVAEAARDSRNVLKMI